MHFVVAVIHDENQDVYDILDQYLGYEYDFFVIGGRWHGMLNLKSPEPDESFDSARIKNIDFSIKEKDLQAFRRFWDVVVEKSPITENEDKMDFFSVYSAEYYKEKYKDKEDYAIQMAKFCTRAVITPDGEWHEPGQMGWFSSSETEDEWREWVDNYMNRFIYPQDPNLYLTIVDCHI